jgi:hypothetical protein
MFESERIAPTATTPAMTTAIIAMPVTDAVINLLILAWSSTR